MSIIENKIKQIREIIDNMDENNGEVSFYQYQLYELEKEQKRAKYMEYYYKNKDKFKEYHRKYQKKNRKKITQRLLKHRKEKAQELKANGQIWVYLSKTERENKMVLSLSKIKNISLEDSRKLLEQANWNYKSLL